MSTSIAHHLPHQAHRQVHPEPHSVLDPLERRTVSSMDLPMQSGGWSLGCQQAATGEMLFTGSDSESHHLSS